MRTRILRAIGDGTVQQLSEVPPDSIDSGWLWVDIVVHEDELAAVAELTTSLDLDVMAVRDAVEDFDLPKVDDFDHHILVVLHGLLDDRIETYEVDCFMTDRHLVTLRHDSSTALDALWQQMPTSAALATGGVDELLARISDVLTRRLMGVLDAFDETESELIEHALAAEDRFLGDLLAVRADLTTVRRVVHPQREVLDILRHSTSRLITDRGRRRFSDVFDVANRMAGDLDAARSTLAEILDAYRGAEAREATDVTTVLTVYAAIMLPLSVVGGFFGMNFANLPLIEQENGWVIVTIAMAVIATVSLGIFIALGWIGRPSGRRAGETLGKGLIEAARAPAQVVGAVYEISTMPIRRVSRRTRRSEGPDRNG